MPDQLRIAVTVEVYVDAFDPRETVYPGSSWRDPDGSWDCDPPVTKLDELEGAMQHALVEALVPVNGFVTEQLRAKIVETVPASGDPL